MKLLQTFLHQRDATGAVATERHPERYTRNVRRMSRADGDPPGLVLEVMFDIEPTTSLIMSTDGAEIYHLSKVSERDYGLIVAMFRDYAQANLLVVESHWFADTGSAQVALHPVLKIEGFLDEEPRG